MTKVVKSSMLICNKQLINTHPKQDAKYDVKTINVFWGNKIQGCQNKFKLRRSSISNKIHPHTHMYTHIYHDDQTSIIGTYTEKRKKPKQC